jgi:hypothetical protein
MDKKDVRWIITPGLYDKVDEFILLYERLYKNKERKRQVPLIIQGDRGIGKSLFLNLFETCFKEDNPDADKKNRIKWLNVAAIPETLIESALFGHEKGAFTGATNHQLGIVENTDLLILEEIGELSHSIQAKLLTFIEDRRYWPLGAKKEKEANKDITIISTTNKKKDDGAFRLDFYDRFFHFSVPPLHQRRVDVLFYLDHFSEGLIKKLYPWEILNLVAHHWPGNVREVERIAQEIKWKKFDYTDSERWYRAETLSLHNTQTDFNQMLHFQIGQSLEDAGVDIRVLESMLNPYGLGIMHESTKQLFKKSTTASRTKEIIERDRRFNTLTYGKFLNTKTRSEIIDIDRGIELLSRLFLTNQNNDANLFSARQTNKYEQYYIPPSNLIHNYDERHEKLASDIYKWVSGKEYNKYELFSVDLFPANRTTTKNSGTPEIQVEKKCASTDLTNMNKDTLLITYYNQLIEKSKGIKAEAARKAGIKVDAFYKEYKRLVKSPKVKSI